jgi:hypothetical protein
MTGLVGASIASVAAIASAAELTPGGQLQTIAIPKRIDLAARPASLNGLKVGDGLQATDASLSGPPAPTRAPLSPLNGLSLGAPSLSAPAASSSVDDDSTPALTQRNGDIRYSVAPNAGFTPFVGLGAGRATGLLSSGLSHPTPYDTDDSLHSYQGLAGFAYKLDKDTSLDFDYRMSNTQRPNVPMIDNANVADQGRDRAAILSLHYDLDPVLRHPPD